MFTPWNKLFAPLLLDFAIFFALWATKIFVVALSFLIGALVCFLGELFFTAIIARKINRKKPEGFMWYFVIAEAIKLVLFAVLFIVAVIAFQLHLFPTFMGFAMNLVCYWILSFKALGKT